SGATVREAARKFHVSKSTVHKDMMERLPLLHSELSRKVRRVLDLNKAERHLRGGQATCIKYGRKNMDA
ncbi:MAG TPA: sporulation transcriptional regulator SpoIIID, partial [Clostridia bacterium]|nr:sporulation transcriptional regulator SpoIIID [Clostridia bacterium]